MTLTAPTTDWESLRTDLLPGGYGRSSLAVGATSPLVRKAQGCWIEVDDGIRLIDTNNNMSVNLYGNAHPRVVEAVHQRMADGLISVGVANPDELVLADELVRRSGWAQQVRFANSGLEAVALALRVARAGTGRDLVVILEPGYHGTADVVLPGIGARGVRGVPVPVVEQTVTVPRGDVEALRRVFESQGERIAAVLLDLCANRAGLTPLSQDFVDTAADLARAAGSRLVIDEVVTFRNAYAGLVGEYGIRPDIAVLGKTIGGGFPIGAIIGSREALAPLDPTGYALEHGGTFTANPISMIAGATTMQMFTPEAVARLNALGERLAHGLAPALDGTGWELRRSGSVFRLFPAGWSVSDRVAAQKELFWAQLHRGVLATGSGLSTLSAVMDEDVIDRLIDSIRDAARSVRPQ